MFRTLENLKRTLPILSAIAITLIFFTFKPVDAGEDQDVIQQHEQGSLERCEVHQVDAAEVEVDLVCCFVSAPDRQSVPLG